MKETKEDEEQHAGLNHRGAAANPHALACHAMTKKDGSQCTLLAMKGQAVCRMHGGSSPILKVAASRRMAETKAMKLLGEGGVIKPVTHPVAALMDLAGEAMKFKDLLSIHVQKLTQIRYESGDGNEQLRGELQAYERALDRTEHFCVNLAKLGLEERQLKIKEEEARIIAGIFMAVFADPELAIPLEKQDQAKVVAARHLRLVTAGAS